MTKLLQAHRNWLTRLGIGLVALALAGADGEDAGDCAEDLVRLQSDRTPLEREYAARRLGSTSCPARPEIARALEAAVRSDDAGVRRAAWASLDRQLTPETAVFLLDLHAERDVAAEEVRLFYNYLSRLARPELAARAAPVLIQGLQQPDDPAVLRFALLGLGRLQQAHHYARVDPLLERRALFEAGADVSRRPSDDAAAAALASARLMGADAALPRAHALSRSESPEVQAAALRLLAELGGPAARETLLALSVDGGLRPENRELLADLLEYLIKTEKLSNTVRFVRADQAAVRTAPNERGAIAASLGRYSILYPEESGELEHRTGAPGPERYAGPWLRVRSSDGIEGWVHASQTARFYPEDEAARPAP